MLMLKFVVSKSYIYFSWFLTKRMNFSGLLYAEYLKMQNLAENGGHSNLIFTFWSKGPVYTRKK